MSTLLAISEIRTDGGTQPRATINSDAIADYMDSMMRGAVFPPLDVFYDGSYYWLADGFHRLKAAEQSSFSLLDCDVHQGTREDAQWFSFAANKANGLRRTNEDKQRAVKAALAHPLGAGKSDHQIAEHVGVDVKTVGNWRAKLVPSMEIPQMRTVIRNGSTYQQNTANIGKRPAPEAQPAVRLTRNEDGAISNPAGGSNISPISRERAWAVQETRNFKKELLRLLRFYEKSHPPVKALVIVRNGAAAVDIQVVTMQEVVA